MKQMNLKPRGRLTVEDLVSALDSAEEEIKRLQDTRLCRFMDLRDGREGRIVFIYPEQITVLWDGDTHETSMNNPLPGWCRLRMPLREKKNDE